MTMEIQNSLNDTQLDKETLVCRVQNQLEQIYGLSVQENVSEYLINKNEALTFLNTPPQQKLPKELLLVRQPEDDTVELALFLDVNLLTNLKLNSPFVALNQKNLSDFCILIEGISHFVYYLWKARQGLSITQLELELQAEIDKFYMLFFYLRSSHYDVEPYVLMETLFEDFELVSHLQAEQKERYLTASSLASRYCHKIQNLFRNVRDYDDIIAEARHFYQLDQADKIRHINH